MNDLLYQGQEIIIVGSSYAGVSERVDKISIEISIQRASTIALRYKTSIVDRNLIKCIEFIRRQRPLHTMKSWIGVIDVDRFEILRKLKYNFNININSIGLASHMLPVHVDRSILLRQRILLKLYPIVLLQTQSPLSKNLNAYLEQSLLAVLLLIS